MKTSLTTLFLTSILFLFYGCKEELPFGGIPAYIRVDELIIDPANSAGEPTHNIANLSFEVLGEIPLNVDIPFIAPILASGPQRTIVRPYIKENGVSAVRRPYPFYNVDTLTIDYSPTDTFVYTPTFRYVNGTQLALNETFALGSSFDNNNIITDCDVCEVSGSDCRCAVYELGNSNRILTSLSAPINIPLNQPVFIELDYRNDVIFSIGVLAQGANGAIFDYLKVSLNAREEWNKIYVDVTEDINNIRGSEYRFFLFAEAPSDSSNANIYIDNFKVLHL